MSELRRDIIRNVRAQFVAASLVLGDYLELTKPRIAVMVLVTVAVAAFVGRWGLPDGWLIVLHARGHGCWSPPAPSAVNQWLEPRPIGAWSARPIVRCRPAG